MPRSRHPLPRLDPRAPLVLDTRELGRRAGSMRRVRFTAPAPADLRTELVGVPEGASLELDLRLEAVMEGVLVTGTVRAPLAGECARCLNPVTDTVEVDLQQLFGYDEPPAGDADDDELLQVVDDRIDLEPALRDALVLALPLSPLCADDCAGLCSTCGERLDDLPADHRHDDPDPRWAALAALRDNDRTDRPEET